ncbi:efflux RND transporter periplasmic adaptor subunit [Gemmatimonadota bacterium]
MSDAPGYPKLREDITFSKVVMRGEEIFIAKDPVRRKYMQFDELGKRFCEICDGAHSHQEIADQLGREFTQYDFDLEYVNEYLENLIGMKLIFRDRIEYNILLMEKVRREREKHNTLLHMSWSAIDPDNLFNWMIKRLQWVASKSFQIFFWIFVIGSYAILIGDLEATWAGLSSFYVFEGWSLVQIVVLYLLILLIIVIHEFGHGLMCKYYGGEVHQMGLLIIYLINPALFCNVSDSYRFPKKYSRVMVVFGGPLVELFVGSIFVYIWWLTDPTLHIHDFAFKIIIFSSISSWIFNMNPLLKYDGYYALSEFVDVPNLRKRSFDYLGYLWKRLLGLPGDMPVGGRREKRIYLTFAIMAFCYSLFIFSLIFGLLKKWLVGSGGAAIGWIVLAFLMYILLRRFIKKGAGFVKLAVMDRSGSIRRNIPIFISVLAILVILPAFIHTPTVDKRLGILEPYYQVNMEAAASGQVTDLRVETGDYIEEGQLLAVIESNSLNLELSGVEQEMTSLQTRAGEAFTLGDDTEANRCLTQVRRLEESRGLILDRIGRLRMVSPLSGRVMNAHVAELEHRWVRQGELLLQVGITDSLRVRLEVPEREMADVEYGSLVKFKPASRAWEVVEGRIVVMDLAGERVEDGESWYGVEIVIDNTDLALVPGQRGKVRLFGKRRSLWAQLVRNGLQTLRLDFFF